LALVYFTVFVYLCSVEDHVAGSHLLCTAVSGNDLVRSVLHSVCQVTRSFTQLLCALRHECTLCLRKRLRNFWF